MYPLGLVDTTDLVAEEAKLLFGDTHAIDSLISIGPGRVHSQDIGDLLKLGNPRPSRKLSVTSSSPRSTIPSTNGVIEMLHNHYNEFVKHIPLETYRRLEPDSVPNVGPNDFLSLKQIGDATDTFLEHAQLPYTWHLLFKKGEHNALSWAACTGNIPVAIALLDPSQRRQPISINWHDDHGYTALHWAARNGHEKFAEKLLAQYGTEVDSVTETTKMLEGIHKNSSKISEPGRTPLHLAAEFGQSKLITLLVLRSAKIEAQTQDGSRALNLAVGANKYQAAKTLLELGADRNATTKGKQTPLHLAIDRQAVDLVKILAEDTKVDVEAETADRKSALELAVDKW